MSTIKQKDKLKEFLRLDVLTQKANLGELKEKLRGFRFDLVAGKVKDVREIRGVKKDVARFETILNLKK